MKLELEIFGSLCATKEFTINGVDAESDDFGWQGSDGSEDGACGNMIFERKSETDEVLKKYNITKKEYEKIAEKLEDGLSFGCCRECV